MSKMGSVVSSLVSRRSYGVYARAAVNVHQASAAAAVAMAKTTTDVAAADASRATTTKKQQDKLFWMRDPKTGCWIPENRFQEVDVVDLRNRLIRQKQSTQN